MWNVELKNWDYISCVTSYDLWVFGPYFPKLPWCLNTHKAGITEPSNHLGVIVRPHLISDKLKTLDYFLCVSTHDLGYLGPVSPNWPNTRVSVKQV